MIESEYKRISRIVDDYFAAVQRTLTGEGDVPEHILRKLEQDGRKVEALLPKMAAYGASRYPNGSVAARQRAMREQVRAARARCGLAVSFLRDRTMQTVLDTITNTAAAAAVGVTGAMLVQAVARALRERRDQTRADFSRTVRTEMHTAKEQGAASAIMAYPEGDATLVRKVCSQGACERCKRAYTNPDGQPKIFTIGELRAGGTNSGRKPDEWEPVVGCMHPHCQCRLEILD